MPRIVPYSKPVRIAKVLWYRLFHSPRSAHEVVSRYRDLRIHFSSTSQIGEAIYSSGFERVEQSIINELLLEGTTVVDVGANVGFFTCLFARLVGRSGRVLAFDPTPSVFSALKKNVERNGLAPQVVCHNVALSERAGTSELNCFPEGQEIYNSLGASVPVDAQVRVQSRMQVEVTTLDRVLAADSAARASKELFVKIDVEGHEHKVVLGGRQLLASHDRCSMMIELFEASAQQCGNSVIDTVNVLKGCGFAVFVISAPGRLTPYTEVHEGQLMDGKLRHPNLFFLKPSVENRLRAQRILQ